MINNRTKILIIVMLITLLAAVGVTAYLNRRKKKTTPMGTTIEPLPIIVSSSSSSSSSVAPPPVGGNGFAITGIGQVVTGANPKQSYHTVVAPARVINLDTTPDGSFPCSVTINNHTESFTLNSNPTGYPAAYFNPADPVWGITAAGNYSVSISVTIGGTVYTQTTSTTVTNQDLGIVVPPVNPPSNQFAQLDMHNLRLTRNGFVYSDEAPNTANAYGRNYHSFYTIMDEAATVTQSFQNVDLTAYAGQILLVRKWLVDVSVFPNYATFLQNKWQIGEHNSDNYLLNHSQAFLYL